MPLLKNPFKRTPKPSLDLNAPFADVDPIEHISNSFTGYVLRHPEQAQDLYNRISPTSPTHENAISVLRSSLTEDPDTTMRIWEQINPTAFSSSPTQEDWYWGRLATGGEEDYYWRRLSDNWYQKDVIPSTFLEILNSCYEAYNANPLAQAIIEITVSFVVGQGIKPVAKTKKVQKLIDAFWNDPDNHMDSRVEDICRELSLYGEIYVRYFVNRYDGSVKIRLVDPALIDQVETDPDDIEKHLRYHRRPIGPSPTQTYDATANTLNPAVFKSTNGSAQSNGSYGLNIDKASLSGQNPADPTMQGDWFKAGEEVQQFAINKVSNAKRGKSDLATLLPWLRRYKDWLTDRVRINKYKGAFLWDVQLIGADAKTIKRKQMDYSYPPEPGSVIIHNEAEKWTAVQPSINANDAKEDGRAIKLMVALGATIPEHYLSDGDNNNRATATQMGLPTFLKFKRRQKILAIILRAILDRVLKEAQKVGKLAASVDIASAYDLIFPEFDHEDNQELGMAVSYLMGGLTQARQQGWISDETAAGILFQFCGLEVDVKSEIEKARAEAALKEKPSHAPASPPSSQEGANQDG